MMCAIHAARKGLRVLLVDQSAKAGGKIPISGGGKCNFPNWGALQTWSAAFITAILFFASVLGHELAHATVGRWRGVPVRNLPTRVIYPENGLSHFRMWRDNLRISAMHTRLLLGMLPRAPGLLWRRWRRAEAPCAA